MSKVIRDETPGNPDMGTRTHIPGEIIFEIPTDKLVQTDFVQYLNNSRAAVTVIRYAKRWYIVDGNNRWAYHKEHGKTHVRCQRLTRDNVYRVASVGDSGIAGWIEDVVDGVESWSAFCKSVVSRAEEFRKLQ